MRSKSQSSQLLDVLVQVAQLVAERDAAVARAERAEKRVTELEALVMRAPDAGDRT